MKQMTVCRKNIRYSSTGSDNSLKVAWKESPMSLKQDATEVLRQTSRTFYLSIVRLPPLIREAVMSSYLSLRAIDEIEDHPSLDKEKKIYLLSAISNEFQRCYKH